MTIPDAAIEAAAEAMTRIVPNSDGVLWEFEDTDPNTGEPVQPRPVTLTDAARAAVEAAMPAIREAIAQEIEAVDLTVDRVFAAFDTKQQIVRIVRGGTP